MIKQSRMYRMPEKQTGCGMVSKCAGSCFLSVCKSPTLSLTFRLTEICFLSFYIIFVLAEFFYMPL